MFMVCNSCTMNLNSFTTSDNAMYSASVIDSTTLFIPLLLHAIGIPQKYMIYPNILILVFLSLAKSLSLSAFSTHFLMLFISLNFNPWSFVSNTNLMSLFNKIFKQTQTPTFSRPTTPTRLDLTQMSVLIPASPISTPSHPATFQSSTTFSSSTLPAATAA